MYLLPKDKIFTKRIFKNKILIFDFKNYSFLKKIYKYIINCTIITIENFQNSIYDLNLSIYDHKPQIIGKRISSLKFGMIRDEIKNKGKNKFKSNNIFVHLGSSETVTKLNKLIPKIIKIYNKNFISKIYVITKFDKQLSNLNNNLVKIVSKKYFLNYFKKCDFHIVNAGVTALESIFLEKLLVAIPQNKYEKLFAIYLKKKDKNLLINLKNIDKIDLTKKRKLNKIKLIDGKGYSRIYRVIRSLKHSKSNIRFDKYLGKF